MQGMGANWPQIGEQGGQGRHLEVEITWSGGSSLVLISPSPDPNRAMVAVRWPP